MKLFTLPDCFTLRFFKSLLTSLPLLFFLISCSKDKGAPGDDDLKPIIDVTTIWETSPFGVPMNDYVGKQWESKLFSIEEMQLFASLDTTNLSGTIKPTEVIKPRVIYPNPFSNTFSFPFSFNKDFSGNVILRLVIVDQSLNPVLKNAVRLSVDSGYAAIALRPDLAPGNYRLYYTLSAQSSPHFFKSWGNIQYTP